MAQFSVTFPRRTITVDANDPREAAQLAAYELARECETGALAQVVTAAEQPTFWALPGRIPETGVHA